MNCHEHQDTVAVAACSEGCGRALCGLCTVRYDPPTCLFCAARLGRKPQANLMSQSDRPFGSAQEGRTR
jgi:hypothetical protein